MAIYPTAAATDADLFVAKNNLSTSLATAIDGVTTTVVLADASQFPTSGYVTIELEAIKYTGISVNTLTGVTRGADGTTAVAHIAGTAVFHNIVANHHNSLKEEVKAIETDLGSRIAFGTDRIRGVAGSVASPTFSFSGDSDTGLFSSAANQISFATNGTEKATITSAGFLGLGTSTPSRMFTIYGSSPYIALQDVGSGDTSADGFQLQFAFPDVAIWNFETGTMRFATDNTERMRLSSAGFLGVGSTNPTRMVTIFGSSPYIAMQDSGSGQTSSDGFQLQFSNPSAVVWNYESGDMSFGTNNTLVLKLSGEQTLHQNGSASLPSIGFSNDTNTGIFRGGADILSVATGGSERMRIDATGQMGLGVASPVRKFHISGAPGAVDFAITDTTTGETSTDGFQIQMRSASSTTFFVNNEAYDFSFFLNGGQKMLLSSGGNLALGSTSSFGSGTTVFFMANATAPSSNPTGGGILYVESGALKFRGSGGTITTVANA